MRIQNFISVIYLRLLLAGLFPVIALTGAAQDAKTSGGQLKFPWAGGLNACQFCAIDLNNDGLDDLLIFDRHGNRKLTFINHGTANTVDYTFEPAYAMQLPELHDWVLTADYNCDGKMDLFTYGMGGVRVFENISGNSLKFRLVTDLLESYYYTGKVGILVTSVDYPALADIDNDGDLDLLTFFGLGSYVEYHQNLSMEKYGHCDSLDFRLADPCWGKFKESEGGNNILLNSPCPYDDISRVTTHASRLTRHTGSTLLATDLNNDGLKDLILGDVDYPGLVALYNGGTVDSALMVARDTSFPSNSAAVHLFSFPVVSNIDIDNDGLADLLVSPFDPGLSTSDNYNCVWFYKNTGSALEPVYQLQSDRLFRNEMMDFGSAAHPVLCDLDGDGLPDLMVGNDGLYDSSYYHDGLLHSDYISKIAFFKNTGTPASPVFSFYTDDLANVSALKLRGAFPAFGDLDQDGRPDMVVGNSDGTVFFFRNAGFSSGLPLFDSPVVNWQGIDVGDYSTPQLFDLDKDGDPDLIIGEQNGNLNYYRNTGPLTSPVFSLVTDSLGKVNVTNYQVSYNGFSTPCFSRMPDGTTFLVVGSDEGRMHLYENIDNNLEGKFRQSAGLYDMLSATPGDTLFGWQTSPAIGQLTDLQSFDLIAGNFSGGLNYITKRNPAIIIPGTQESTPQHSNALMVFPNPADREVSIRLDGVSTHPLAGRIENMFGQSMLEFYLPCSVAIPLSGLPAGMYIVRLGAYTAKLIISHP